MLRTLRQVEQRTAAIRQTKRAETEVAVGDEVFLAKDEVGIAGGSPAPLKAIATVARAARSTASLVLTGETGSGKDLSCKPSSSATSAVLSRAPSARDADSSSRPREARSSSTRSAR